MSRPRGLFLAGTDTDAGKTIMAAAIVAGLRAKGIDCGYLKPVGTEALDVGNRPVNPDAVFVKEMAGLTEPAWELNPYCLQAPLAPLAAARAEGTAVPYDNLLRQTNEYCRARQFTIVEGAGGVLVPLAQGKLMLDLMAEVGLPVLVVGRAGLGTVNHTLLTIRAVRNAGLPVAGFCFSGGQRSAGDCSPGLNPDLVVEFGGAPYLGTLPHLPELTARALREAALERLDLNGMIG